MDFAKAIENEQKWTRTENGAVALNTTGTAVLDLFSTIGALRDASEARIETLVNEAYAEDPELTVKCIFYARDVREGLGERNTFRVAIKYLANKHPEAVINNIRYFGEYGRYDDLYCLVGTPVEDEMWRYVSAQLRADMANCLQNKSVSLLAKWLKTADASSEKTRKLGIYTAKKLGVSVYLYKRAIRKLRKYIDITEAKMCAKKWDKIDYSAVPSRAAMIYREAFKKHDEERYNSFINKVNTGEEKINASTLYPYDLVRKYWDGYSWNRRLKWYDDDTVEALWSNLPNYVSPGTNAIIIADTSGSMNDNDEGKPMDSALGLALYFAQRNTGAYHGLWMNFSSNPSWQKIKGETLFQMLQNVNMNNWNGSTNLQAAFQLVLETAVRNNVSPDEMPKALIVISDMEIDRCTSDKWTFYDTMKLTFAQYGYKIPQVIFWNVHSRHDVFHADDNRKGVILCSGHSTTIFKNLINTIEMTPVEYMIKVLKSERYNAITVA